MNGDTIGESVAFLRKLARDGWDEFRLRVVYPLVDAAKAVGASLRDMVAELRVWLSSQSPEPVPAKARFVEYGIHDYVLGSAFVLHDRMTNRAVGPFVDGDLEDVANTLEHHPEAYFAEPELLKTIAAGKTSTTRVVLPRVLL